MSILTSIKIRNYRNLRNVDLTNLKSFNIFIGPSNCGKSNILRSIELLSKIRFAENTSFSDRNGCKCDTLQKSWNIQNYNEAQRKFRLCGGSGDISKEEMYKKEEKIKIEYDFNENFLSEAGRKLTPEEFIDKLSNAIASSNYGEGDKDNAKRHIRELKELRFSSLVLEQFHEGSLPVRHVSWFCDEKVAKYVKERIIFIEDSRLQTYKGANILDYIRSKNLAGEKINRLIGFLREIIDPRIKDYKQNSLELIFDDGFEDQINSQGSGVRSLICLAVDILSAKDKSIILIDEPELGLNPHTKQAFLKFLLKEESKQIFISTHDPTFLNPLIWADKDVAVYFFSPLYDRNSGDKEEPNFVRINLEESKEDPHIFSGYLPHTESLKKIHIYVEGSRDVYALQEYLLEHLQKSGSDEWLKLFNNIGIHHLAGNFWKHLLYTILKPPYKCIVILDKDKLSEAREVCDAYTSVRVNAPSFMFCETVKNIQKALKEKKCPIYCLNNGCLEDLNQNTSIKNEIKSIISLILEKS